MITRVAWWGLSLGLIRACDVKVSLTFGSLDVRYLNEGLDGSGRSAVYFPEMFRGGRGVSSLMWHS